MHKRAFRALKRTFVCASGLSPPYFDKTNKLLYKLFLLSKSVGGRPETCIKVRFSP